MQRSSAALGSISQHDIIAFPSRLSAHGPLRNAKISMDMSLLQSKGGAKKSGRASHAHAFSRFCIVVGVAVVCLDGIVKCENHGTWSGNKPSASAGEGGKKRKAPAAGEKPPTMASTKNAKPAKKAKGKASGSA